MWNAVVEEPQAVVFVSDRSGAALRRRERCLKLAGIPHSIEAERRPSGTYYKLIVREQDAVAAHLALQMGGCGRSLKLQDSTPTVGATLKEIARTMWDELALMAGKLLDLVWSVAPRLLTGPTTPDRHADA
jgi:hypothetical protein